MDAIDTRGFYENYVNAINNHDFDRMEAFYSRSIRFQLYDTLQNFDALIDGLRGINSAFPDWHWKVLEVLFDGKLITARYADTGTHMGLFQGVEPTGRKVQALEFAVYRFDGNWSVVAQTTQGHCGSMRFGLAINRGRLYSAGGYYVFGYPAQLGGRVSPSGYVHVNAVAGPRTAHADGRLQRFQGSGTWAGSGPSGVCSGVWNAAPLRQTF